MSNAFDTKLQPVNELIASLKSKVEKREGSMGALESFANESDKRLSQLESDQETLWKENKTLRLKLDQLENHSCKCNIQVLGLENNIEAGNPTYFMNNCLCELLRKEKMGLEPPAVTAHRTGPPHKTSRCMIMRLYS